MIRIQIIEENTGENSQEHLLIFLFIQYFFYINFKPKIKKNLWQKKTENSKKKKTSELNYKQRYN